MALIAAGRLSRPFEGRNEADAVWMRDEEWWWNSPITLPPSPKAGSTELTFEGLDILSYIYLDGVRIGGADDIFRT